MTTTNTAASSPYGLTRPTLTEVHAAVQRTYHDRGEQVWTALLNMVGLSGNEVDPDAVTRLIMAATTTGDPILALIAHAQQIRLASFDHLSAAHDILTSVR